MMTPKKNWRGVNKTLQTWQFCDLDLFVMVKWPFKWWKMTSNWGIKRSRIASPGNYCFFLNLPSLPFLFPGPFLPVFWHIWRSLHKLQTCHISISQTRHDQFFVPKGIFPKNHGISKLMVWRSQKGTLLYRFKTLHRRVQWFLGLYFIPQKIDTKNQTVQSSLWWLESSLELQEFLMRYYAQKTNMHTQTDALENGFPCKYGHLFWYLFINFFLVGNLHINFDTTFFSPPYVGGCHLNPRPFRHAKKRSRGLWSAASQVIFLQFRNHQKLLKPMGLTWPVSWCWTGELVWIRIRHY